MQIITLEQARMHSRIDDDTGDDDLQIKIDAATEACLDYIGSKAADLFDDTGQPKTDEAGNPIRGCKRVMQAILVTVAWMYEERDGSQKYRVADTHGYGYALPQAAIALLYSMRKPTAV